MRDIDIKGLIHVSVFKSNYNRASSCIIITQGAKLELEIFPVGLTIDFNPLHFHKEINHEFLN